MVSRTNVNVLSFLFHTAKNTLVRLTKKHIRLTVLLAALVFAASGVIADFIFGVVDRGVAGRAVVVGARLFAALVVRAPFVVAPLVGSAVD